MTSGKMLAGVAAIALLGINSTASATTFLSPDGNASADITQSGDTLTVALTELLANPTEANQLSGIDIIFDTGHSPSTASLATQSGQLIDITKGSGTFTLVAGSPDHWGVDLSGTSLVLATVGLSGGKPRDLIVDNGGHYSNANSSFTQHQPQIKGTGTFTITLPNGFDALPNIDGVKFQFSTTAGYNGPLVPNTFTSPAPEPATWAMFLVGFGALGFMMRGSRRNGAVAAA